MPSSSSMMTLHWEFQGNVLEIKCPARRREQLQSIQVQSWDEAYFWANFEISNWNFQECNPRLRFESLIKIWSASDLHSRCCGKIIKKLCHLEVCLSSHRTLYTRNTKINNISNMTFIQFQLRRANFWIIRELKILNSAFAWHLLTFTQISKQVASGKHDQ